VKKRSLLWILLVAAAAGTLTGATRAVRAETTTSSAIGSATSDGRVATPYFWTVDEMAKQGEERQAILSITCGYYHINVSGGLGLPTAHALVARALD